MLLFYAAVIQLAALTSVSPVTGVIEQHKSISFELAHAAYDEQVMTIFSTINDNSPSYAQINTYSK